MMDLYCTESETVLNAYEDPVILEDARVFQNLLVIEEKYVLSSSYFKCIQIDLKPEMRSIVAEWMLEVCEGERCQDEVFPLAVNCLDRFLSLVRVKKCHLQLLGAVCLFLASKLRQSRPITAERLCLYSDNSISVSQLLDWELLVLTRLKWDLCAVTPFDFVAHILKQLPVVQGRDLVKRHAHTFISFCATDVNFSMHTPSMIAAASIGAAIQGLIARLDTCWSSPTELLMRLHKITGIDADCLRACWDQIEESVVTRIAAASHSITSTIEIPLEANHKLAEQEQVSQQIVQAETPTDVQDVHF